MTSSQANPDLVIPLREETITVSKERIASGGVRVDVTVDEQPIALDVDLKHEDVEVERVSINRIVDVPAQTRMDGDVLVVPIHEEIIVKQLFLKEELRIKTTSRRSVHRHEDTVRKEQVHITEIDPNER